MFVKVLTADDWHDYKDRGVETANPTWDQVRQAILALDGKQRTIVSIGDKLGSGHYLLVAGQWAGRLLVNATRDNTDFFSLVDPSRTSDNVTLYVGGQDGEFEERKCVPLAWALEAAEHFFETGDLKSTMNWQSDY